MLVYSSAMSSSRLDVNTTRYPSSSLLLFLMLLGVAMATLTPEQGDQFDPSTYCQNACSLGRGGNVCRCSATKFAGKRSRMLLLHSPALDDDDVRLNGSVTLFDGGWGPHRQIASRLHTSRLHRRHSEALRWIGSRLLQSGTNERNFLRDKFTV